MLFSLLALGNYTQNNTKQSLRVLIVVAGKQLKKQPKLQKAWDIEQLSIKSGDLIKFNSSILSWYYQGEYTQGNIRKNTIAILMNIDKSINEVILMINGQLLCIICLDLQFQCEKI